MYNTILVLYAKTHCSLLFFKKDFEFWESYLFLQTFFQVGLWLKLFATMLLGTNGLSLIVLQ